MKGYPNWSTVKAFSCKELHLLPCFVPDILTNEDIVLYENGQPITNFEIGEPIDGPVTVIFVIDLGQAANLTLHRPAKMLFEKK